MASRRGYGRWAMGLLTGVLVFGAMSGARALEPQAIVGEWVGEWNNGGGVSDAVYMTITKVSGERVEGTVYWQATAGAPSENHELRFVGSLVGSTLSVRGAPTVPGSPAMSFSYNISRDGTRMAGFFEGDRRSAVSFDKKP